jgi:hypothetical protein
MVKGRIGKIIPPEMEETEPLGNVAHWLRLPTLDERANLYLRAVYGDRDFTNEEYATAQDCILDEVANGIAAELRGHSRDSNVPGMRGGQSAFLTSTTPSASRPGEGVEFGAVFARLDLSRSNSTKPHTVEQRLRPIAKRRTFIAAMAIAATALLVTGAYRLVWLATDRNVETALMGDRSSPTVAGVAGIIDDNVGNVRVGQALTSEGKILAARLVLRKPADADSPEAALSLGITYDPFELENLGVRDVLPDEDLARYWYQKAKDLGSTEARIRLDRLAAREGRAR